MTIIEHKQEDQRQFLSKLSLKECYSVFNGEFKPCILPSMSLAEDDMVDANSMVRKDVSQCKVVGGLCARKIKEVTMLGYAGK